MANLVPGINTLTKAQLLALLASTSNAAIANNLGPMTIRWHRNPGNTGPQDGLDATFSIQLSHTPILVNETLTYGNRTPVDAGSVLLKNLRLKANNSPDVSSWIITFVSATAGGASSDWKSLPADTANATARTPQVSTTNFNDLTTVTLPATTYVFSVTAKGSDGSISNTVTLTINTIPNAANIGDYNMSFGHGDAQDTWRSRWATDTGNITILLSTGWSYQANNPVLYFENFIPSNPAHRTTLRPADPTRPSIIGQLVLRNCARFDAYDMAFGGTTLTKVVFETGSVDSHLYGGRTIGTSIANIHAADPKSQCGVSFVNDCVDCTAEDLAFEWTGRAVAIGTNSTRCKVLRSSFRYHHGDGVFFGASTDCVVDGCTFVSPMRYPGDNDHIDHIQYGDSVTITRPVVTNTVWLQADGNTSPISMQNGATLCDAPVLKNLVFFGRSVRFLNMFAVNNADIENITYFSTMSGKIAMTHATESDNISNVGTDLLQVGSTGANVMKGLFTSGRVLAMGPTFTLTNIDALDARYTAIHQFAYADSGDNHEPVFDEVGVRTFDFSPALNYSNAFERTNNYHAVNNPIGYDYVGKTVAEIRTYLLGIVAPKIGGTLDKGGGVTSGAVNFDGTLKDLIIESSASIMLPQTGDIALALATLSTIPVGNTVTITIPSAFPVTFVVPGTPDVILPAGASTITKAQALSLIQRTVDDGVATGLGPVVITARTAAANTGAIKRISVTYAIEETQVTAMRELPPTGDVPIDASLFSDRPASNTVTVTIPASFPVDLAYLTE